MQSTFFKVMLIDYKWWYSTSSKLLTFSKLWRKQQLLGNYSNSSSIKGERYRSTETHFIVNWFICHASSLLLPTLGGRTADNAPTSTPSNASRSSVAITTSRYVCSRFKVSCHPIRLHFVTFPNSLGHPVRYILVYCWIAVRRASQFGFWSQSSGHSISVRAKRRSKRNKL